jgi:fibronectin type 3 domain-containing protein
MRKPFHSSPALRGLFLFFFVALSLLAGCGKLRRWYNSAQKEQDNPHSVTIAWAASNSQVAGYNVYRSSPPSGPVRLTVRIVSGTQYIDKTVEAGRTYTYSVTSVDFKGIESIASKDITVTVPTAVTPPAKQ